MTSPHCCVSKFLGMWSIGDSVGLAGGVTEALMIFRDFPALCYPMTAMVGITWTQVNPAGAH